MSTPASCDGSASEASVAIPADRSQDEPPAASVGPGTNVSVALAGPQHSPLLAGIAKLKAEQKALKAEKKRVAKELKNQEKKRARLKTKAKQLTDEDLLQVLNLRAVSKAEQAAKPSNSSSAASGQPACSTACGSNE